MAANLVGQVGPQLTSTHTNTVGVSSVTDIIQQNTSSSFSYGTGANQCDTAYSATGTLAATATTIDFSSAGSLKDAFGASIQFARIKSLLIINQATTDGFNLTIGAAATFPIASIFGGVTTSKLTIPAGGFVLLNGPLATGFVVTSGSACQLKIDPGANSIPYLIVALGCSA